MLYLCSIQKQKKHFKTKKMICKKDFEPQSNTPIKPIRDILDSGVFDDLTQGQLKEMSKSTKATRYLFKSLGKDTKELMTLLTAIDFYGVRKFGDYWSL